jgi:3',5'-cyclic AMP phosphodiesterase CpdA
MKMVLLSDLHLGASSDTFAACAEVFTRIHKEHAPDDTVVVLAGDVTEHGKKAEFDLANLFIDRLRAADYHVMIVPGNHDYGPFGNVYHPGAQAEFHKLALGRAPYVLDLPEARIIGLDSCYQPGRAAQGGWAKVAELFAPERRFANGSLGIGQLDALSAWLEDGKPTHVVLHHHPLFHHLGLRLVDANAFWRVVSRRAKGVYFGHRHKAQVYDGHEGIPIVRALGSTGHQRAMSVITL